MNHLILLGSLIGCASKHSTVQIQRAASPSEQVRVVDGHLDRHLIDEEIRRHASQIYSCYATPRYKSPSENPGIVVAFVILTEDGTVASATAQQDTIGLVRIKDCILSVFMKMQFPAGMVTDTVSDRYIGESGELGVMIVYPIVFNSK